MQQRFLAWSGAATVMAVTVVLVVLDLSDASVRDFWSHHSFTSSVVSGLLVLLLTVLIVDRVAAMRRLTNQSRAIAAQAAVLVAQASRAADAIADATAAVGGREDASAELRSYTQMLLTSAPVLIEAKLPRAFLETAQRLAYQLFRALQDEPAQAQRKPLDAAVRHLREAAAPLLTALNREQRTAVVSEETETVT